VSSAFISFDHVSFTYRDPNGGLHPVLRDLSLEIGEGERVAILGSNGSGKTTLIRHINGLLLPDAGQVSVGGLNTRSPANRRALFQLVGMVFQHPEDQVVAATVEDDVAFGPENLGLPAPEIQRRVEEALLATGLYEIRQRPPHLLSAGQVQRLALAGVLAMRPRCVVFDEATTMLDPVGRRMALDWMRRLHRQGLTVVYVTHHMEEAAIAGRVIVLDRGQVALDGTPRHVFGSRSQIEALGLELPPAAALSARLRPVLPWLPAGILTAEALRAAIADFGLRSPAGRVEAGPPEPDESQPKILAPAATSPLPLIEVARLSHTYLLGTPLAQRSLFEASLQVQSGRPHGLLGRTGSGKSTFLQHLNGLLRPQSGTVRVGPYLLNDPAVLTRTVIQTVGLVFQNPEMQFFETFVGDEIAFGPRQVAGSGSLAGRVRAAMALVGLDFNEFKDRRLFTLSGGEQRKVALASTLALQPSILLLDEPTAGLDPRSHREILDGLRQLQAGGMDLVLSSHRMDDLAELAADLSLFSEGQISLSGPMAEVFARGEALADAGLEQPLAVQAAAWLRQACLALPAGIATPHQLVEAVKASSTGVVHESV
jgi:energy-coupling factor transporter ATPase